MITSYVYEILDLETCQNNTDSFITVTLGTLLYFEIIKNQKKYLTDFYEIHLFYIYVFKHVKNWNGGKPE